MKYAELSDEAKAKARDWYREAGIHDNWWDATYEDAVIVLGFLGFDATETVRIKAGRVGSDGLWESRPTIEFSGFCSQGDGASFTGKWQASGVDMAQLIGHIGQDETEDGTLGDICAQLSALALRWPDASVTITRNGSSRYAHSGTMGWGYCELVGGAGVGEESDEDIMLTSGIVTTQARLAADWIYKQLEEAHDWLQSDACVVENIEANEYDFTEDGECE